MNIFVLILLLADGGSQRVGTYQSMSDCQIALQQAQTYVIPKQPEIEPPSWKTGVTEGICVAVSAP